MSVDSPLPQQDSTAPEVDGTIAHADLTRLHDYWLSKRAGRRFPARADIDPQELRFLLGSILLIDVLWEPLRFRYRLTGTTIVLTSGYSLHGRGPEEVEDEEYRARIFRAFERVATAGVPYARTTTRMLDGRPRTYDALVLPLSGDQRRVDMLLGAQIYRPE